MNLTLGERTWQAYIPLISANMHRLTYLLIEMLDDDDLADDVADTLESALAQPAPLLHTFILWDAALHRSRDVVPLLFANHAPRLRSIKFHGSPQLFSKSAVALQSVTSLLLSSGADSTFGASSLQRHLALFPQLQRLAIELRGRHDKR